MEEKIDLIEDSNLNIDGVENKPVCPVCQAYLEEPKANYAYKRTNPDTRWFWCGQCEGHLGYHRMKKRWRIDPYDLNNSPTFREQFSLAENI